jgi:predicted dehydrogenase
MVSGLLKTGKVELVAVAEDDPKLMKLAQERWGATWAFKSWAKCLDEAQPDIVALTTRNFEKQRVVADCFERGIGVFADKPIFTDARWLAKCERLWKAAKVKPALSALFGVRSSREGFGLKKLVDSGELGEIVHLYKCRPHRLRPEGRSPWEVNNRENGGPVIDLASHDVDYAMWLIGSEPTEVIAYGKLSRFKQLKGFWDNGQIMVRFRSGAVFMLEADWLTPEKSRYHGDCRALVTGTEGFAEMLEHLVQLKVTTFTRPEREVKLPKRTFSLCEDFLAQVAGKRSIVTAPQMFKVHRVLLAANESAKAGGKKIRL